MRKKDEAARPETRGAEHTDKADDSQNPVQTPGKYRGWFATAEAELKVLKKSLESVSTGITIADIEGRIIYTNPAEAKMHGYKVRDLIGRNVRIFSPGIRKEQGKAKEAGLWKEWTREVTNVRSDGTTFPVQLKSIPVHESGEDPSHIITISEDITERKKAEEALRGAYDELEEKVEERTRALREANWRLEEELRERRRAENELRLLGKFFESTSEAVVIVDANARVVDVNGAFTRITGYEKKDVIGQIPGFLMTDCHDRYFYAAMWKTVRTNGCWQGEVPARRKNGEICPLWLSISPVTNDEGEITNYVGISADISTLKKTEEKLEHLAHYDPLTGLPNRALFNDRLMHTIAFARRHCRIMALLLLDLDRFKEVNDTLGHRIGDQLLVAVSRRLQSRIRESDTISRLGGDEFAIILSDIESFDSAAVAAQHFLGYLSDPFMLEGHEVYITASVGITIYPSDSEDMDTMFKNADTAMYWAKGRGKNNFQFFTTDMNNSILEKNFIESRLRHALENDEISLCFQPQIETKTERIVGMEALVRWVNPELGEVPPSKFIPVAEDTGLIAPIGEWVLREACLKNRAWQEDGLTCVTVSVNISARQFHKQNLVEVISGILDETGLDPRYLELEITESVIMQDVEDTIETLRRLKDLGIGLSVDDFGTGYSSLSYLKRFPIDELKIDQSFVLDITKDPDDASVVCAVIALAHNMSLKVVAEGVETREQLDFLRKRGCDMVQGYYFERPIPDGGIRDLLRGEKLSTAEAGESVETQ